MNGHVKKALVGLLAGGAIAIWAPQIMSLSNSSSETARPDRGPDDEFAGESSVEEYAASNTRSESSDGTPQTGLEEDRAARAEPAPGPSTPNSLGSRLDDLAPVLEALRTFVPKESPTDLDRAASAVALMGIRPVTSPDQEVQSTTDITTPEASTETLAPSTEIAQDAAVDWATSFLQDNALTGILFDGENSVALLGGRVVRIGDELAGGHLVVTHIDAERMTLESTRPRSSASGIQSDTYHLDLPPFRPSIGSSSQGEASASESDGAAAGEPGESE